MGGCEGLSKTDGKHSSDTWTRPGDYIARTKAKATAPSRLIQILVDEQFEQLAPILDIIPGRERGGSNGFFIGNI